MIRDFFLDKFEYDHACNKEWIKCVIDHEDKIDRFIISSFSHLINVHHRWISRLEGIQAESGIHDIFYPEDWLRLCTDNFLKTENYLEHADFEGIIHYYNDDGLPLEKEAIDILYHILNHSNYHRAQIAMQLRKLDIIPPSLNFIAYH